MKGQINVNESEEDGDTSLLKTCENGHLEILQLLLQNESLLVNKGNNNGETGLYSACSYAHIEVVQELLKIKDINVNCEKINDSEKGSTPLIIASYIGESNIVQLLLERSDIKLDVVCQGKNAIQWSQQNVRNDGFSYLDESINEDGRKKIFDILNNH
jgi:ankyrin repeat protein